jgi:beta-barrel assembly-enhancing protease
MRTSSAHRHLWLAFSLILIATPAFAQDKSTKNSQKDSSKSLSENENPDMIGKRNINKHQINFYSIDKEVALGRQYAQEVDRTAKLIEDPLVVDYINKVGQNLVLHSDAKVPFTIKVIDSEEINAFALPGGFFYVNRGLILAADNEAELAGPMAHEIAHVAARHGVEQASKGQIVNFSSLPLIFLGGWGGFAVQQVAGLAIPLGFLKFSRGAEYEADMLGAQYLYATGYDPRAMSTFFEKLQAQDKKKPGTIVRIFSTHPMVPDRIDRVNSLIARFPDRSDSGYVTDTSEFLQVKRRLISLTNARSTGKGGSGASDADSKRPTLKRRQPGSPEGTDPSADQEQKAPSEKPTLRRKDGESSSTKPPNQ